MKKITLLIITYTCIVFGQTSEQIKKAKELVRKSGMSESEARNAAKSQGYSDQQIDAVIQKEKLPKIGADNPSNQSIENSIPIEPEQSNELILEGEMEVINEEELNIESSTQPARKVLPYYGYDIFKRDPAIFQATSVGIVDPDYLIGPGDEIIVMLWGETQFRQVFPVDREGFVFIPEIGQVFVNGLNLNLLESKLFRVFSQSYASLNPQGSDPTTFLDVSLGNLRPLRIQVLGEVRQPGAYTVSPSATLFSALYYFNGPTTSGSLRDVRLIRNGKEIASIDFYDYLLSGKKPKDQKLQLDDVIFIPRRLKSVTIEGEINRSGIYELKPEEGLSDLINLAGSLKITAYLGRSQIDRIVPFYDRAEKNMDRMIIDVNLEEVLKSEEQFPIQDGDRIQIFSVLDLRQNVVELRGSVTRQGNYDLGKSLKLSELIERADGLLGDAYLNRVDIIRVKPDFSEELIKLNLQLAMNKDSKNDIQLQSMDRVKVYGMTEMVSQSYVYIEGHVKKPGRFPLQDNMRLYDLIFKSGGFVDESFKKMAYLNRADLLRMDDDRINRSIIPFNLQNLLENPESNENLMLVDNDLIRIYKKTIFKSTQKVEINGSILKPGVYNLKSEMNLNDLILEAGGMKNKQLNHKIEIARLDPNNNDLNHYAKVITLTVNGGNSKTFESNNGQADEYLSDSGTIKLQPNDLISVRPDPFSASQKLVSISGEVLYPGDYTILNSNEKITDIIERAGGLRPNAYLNSSQYIRNGERINIAFKKIMKNPKSKINFKVQNGDEIIINKEPNFVRILGEVNSSGLHKYLAGKRLKYYLKIAGGFSPDADKNNIWIVYPNGDSKKYNRWSIFSPNIIDGSIIHVGRKPDEEPFDHTEYAKELTSIIANLAQAISIVVLASR